MKLKYLKIKISIEQIIVYPFILIGKLYAKLFPLKTKHDVFLIFSNADLGGSIQVNYDLASCLKDKNPLIIFSKKPKNNQFLSKYIKLNLKIIDLHKQIDNKIYHWLNFIYRGIIVEWAIQSNIEAIIGGECIYFYKIISHLPDKVKKIEILHVDSWLDYTIGFQKKIDFRVFSTLNLKKKVENLYINNNIIQAAYDKLVFIENGIHLHKSENINNGKLQVYYIGRGSPQKRVDLVAAIAENIHKLKTPIEFNFVGDVEKVIDIAKYPYCNFHGSVYDEESMNQIYNKADVLILTSAYEGLPLVIMDMMARGKTIVSTAVDSIPDYIIDNHNGLLIKGQKKEDIIAEGTKHLIRLQQEPELRKRFGQNNIMISESKFNINSFCENYKNLLKKENLQNI